MSLSNYYELLEIPPTASADEVRKAFRRQIARYHPDKVQHLGREFQTMAADRASQLTEAYRILSDERLRAEYDQARAAAAILQAAPPASEPAGGARPSPHAPAPSPARKPGDQFVQERTSRDQFVRSATIDRFRQALAQAVSGGYDESSVRGFDVACVPKPKLFARASRPRVLGRFVPRVDAAAVADAWVQAAAWNVPRGEEICVILMGTVLAPPQELAAAIAEQRRRPARGGKVTLIPVDARVWNAHMPSDAPAVAKDILTRLRSGT